MAGKWANSRRAQVYRYLAANLGKVVHVDKMARHLGLPVDHGGLQKARRPIYDLINNGDVELEQLVAGGCWRVIAVIGDDETPEGGREVERDEADATEALGASHPPQVAAPTTVTYEFVGNSHDGHAPIVRDSTGRLYRLERI